ncbi:hypothetical protein M2451_003879 [Dysgonomonas sp. PFB1-18]|uniref:hypothetical protein n=1 Tax=unclassified Dysgonomonas TaxID=2630389 RepID=UPI002473834A|nr:MULTISPECIES: hypothetical protein [unclassified Dysgonomonas]MDH6311206.1 hypothetical protein [Dysgonomonas sp. PF1-14]MDH6341102.1 hypothetical protein [Dysgonomonas sp. PF1-16]MDH6382538.1 hypothetical protein [Dysgonomonas sp. PFB1-18]MDH6399928.1 hypothetical protein [Dysgonomonas sp. PF1-23]
METNNYLQQGYESRKAYLQDLANQFGIDYDIVLGVAEMLGAAEDFDGLPSTLEDFAFISGF